MLSQLLDSKRKHNWDIMVKSFKIKSLHLKSDANLAVGSFFSLIAEEFEENQKLFLQSHDISSYLLDFSRQFHSMDAKKKLVCANDVFNNLSLQSACLTAISVLLAILHICERNWPSIRCNVFLFT